MSKVKVHKHAFIIMLTCFFAATMMGINATQANAITTDTHVDQLFQQARMQSAQLVHDAEVMETFTYSGEGWRSNADEVGRVRDHINKLGKLISEIQALRGEVSKHHQVTIDRIIPPLRELADNTTAIIHYLNKYEGRLQLPPYTSYLQENVHLSNNLYQVISDTVEYDHTKDEIGRLQTKLAKVMPSK